MDIGLHQIAKRPIHELVALQGGEAGEILGDDANAEVSPAVARAGVPGVQMAVVSELDLIGVQGVLQP
jgi:hypothetical protein